ncbi:MAG: hypothetical protein AAFZ07_08995 [Actinomycetota bacterium]
MASPRDRGGPLSDPLTLDLALAGARAALGVGLLLAPGAVASMIVGDAARSPGAKLLSRAAGVRDMSMAVVSIWALDRPDDLPRTHRLHAIVDACDAAAGVVAFRHLTPLGRAFAVVGGSSSALTGYVQSRRWRRELAVDGATS